MTRIASAALIALVSLGAVAANAASLPASALKGPRDLAESGLNANDTLQVTVGVTKQVRAGDLLSQRELTEAGLRADSLVTVSAFEGAANPVYPQNER